MSASLVLRLVAAFAGANALVGGAGTAMAGGFDCMASISDARATQILKARATVVAGGGGIDDCGIRARRYQGIIITGYVVKRSFFDRLRHTTRSGKRSGDDGATVEYTQRTLHRFGGPAFSLETKTWFEGYSTPSIVRSVFVYRRGRMPRPTTPDTGPRRLATVNQLIRIARVCARRI